MYNVFERTLVIEDKELPINQDITALLKRKPVEVTRGRSHDKLKKTLQKIDSIYNLIQSGVSSEAYYIEEYCSNLKNELQSAKEEHIQALEGDHLVMLNEIDKFKNERISKLETKVEFKNDFNGLLDELKEFNQKTTLNLIITL